jgi:hypothetical protein
VDEGDLRTEIRAWNLSNRKQLKYRLISAEMYIYAKQELRIGARRILTKVRSCRVIFTVPARIMGHAVA